MMSDDGPIDVEPENVRLKRSLYNTNIHFLRDPETERLLVKFKHQADYERVKMVAKFLSSRREKEMNILKIIWKDVEDIKKIVNDLKEKENALQEEPEEIIDLDSDDCQEIIEVSVDESSIKNRIPIKFFPSEHAKWFPHKFDRQRKRPCSPINNSSLAKKPHVEMRYNSGATSSSNQNMRQMPGYGQSSNQNPGQNARISAMRRNSVCEDNFNGNHPMAPPQNSSAVWNQNAQQSNHPHFFGASTQQFPQPQTRNIPFPNVPVAAFNFQQIPMINVPMQTPNNSFNQNLFVPMPNFSVPPPRVPPPRSMSLYQERPNENRNPSSYAEYKRQRQQEQAKEASKSRWEPPKSSAVNKNVHFNVDPRRPQNATASNSVQSDRPQLPPKTANNSNINAVAPSSNKPIKSILKRSSSQITSTQQSPSNKPSTTHQKETPLNNQSSKDKPLQNFPKPSSFQATNAQQSSSSKPPQKDILSKYAGAISSNKPVQSMQKEKATNSHGTNAQQPSTSTRVTQKKDDTINKQVQAPKEKSVQNVAVPSKNHTTNARQSASSKSMTKQKDDSNKSNSSKNSQQTVMAKKTTAAAFNLPKEANSSMASTSSVRTETTEEIQAAGSPSFSNTLLSSIQSTVEQSRKSIKVKPSTSSKSNEKKTPSSKAPPINIKIEIKKEIIDDNDDSDDDDLMDDDTMQTAMSECSGSDNENAPERMEFEGPQQENLAAEVNPPRTTPADFIPMIIKTEAVDSPLASNSSITLTEANSNEDVKEETKVKCEPAVPDYDGNASTEVEDNNESIGDSESSSGSEASAGILELLKTFKEETDFMADVGRIIPKKNSQLSEEREDRNTNKVQEWLQNVDSPPDSPCFDFPMTKATADDHNWEYPEDIEDDDDNITIIPFEPNIAHID